MIVEPIPPGWNGAIVPGKDYNVWLDQIMGVYGRGKPSMLQDIERGRLTEIDFINGYVTQLGKQIGIPVPMNTAITDLVHQIERWETQPDAARLDELLQVAKEPRRESKSRIVRVVTCFAPKSWLRLGNVNASLTPCVVGRRTCF